MSSYQSSSYFALDAAIDLPWISFDSADHANIIAIDVDHSNVMELSEELAVFYRLTRPIVIQDPWSGRAHVLFLLSTPVITAESGRRGPKALLSLAGNLLAAALDGTFLPRGCLVKNPFGLTSSRIGERLRRVAEPALPLLWAGYRASGCQFAWHTYSGDCQTYELNHIVAALIDDFGNRISSRKGGRPFRRTCPEPSDAGRNCALFDLLRFFAYEHNERNGSTILAEAERLNKEFFAKYPLAIAEVRSSAKSVTRFMNTRFRFRAAGSKRRGRDTKANAHLDAGARRQLAGRKSGAQNRSKTDARIEAAVDKLAVAGIALTQAAIAREAGLSERTVWSRRNPQNGAHQGSSSTPLPVEEIHDGGEQPYPGAQKPPPARDLAGATPAGDRGGHWFPKAAAAEDINVVRACSGKVTGKGAAGTLRLAVAVATACNTAALFSSLSEEATNCSRRRWPLGMPKLEDVLAESCRMLPRGGRARESEFPRRGGVVRGYDGSRRISDEVEIERRGYSLLHLALEPAPKQKLGSLIVKSLSTATPISRPIATPRRLDRTPRSGVYGC